MNAYARQFVEQMSAGRRSHHRNPPTVSIEQRNSRGGGKSTLATVTEIYHFLRLLFARWARSIVPIAGAAKRRRATRWPAAALD